MTSCRSSLQPLLWTTYLIWTTCSYWSASATVLNVTIDDTYGDTLTGGSMHYSPENAWKANLNCTGCKAQPDPLSALGGTWHESAIPQSGSAVVPTVVVEFEGSAVYVYCIIPDSRASVDGFPNMRFVLDGVLAGSYSLKPPAGTGAYDYHTLVFASQSLASELHVLEIENGVPQSGGSILLLDYILYTTDANVTSVATNVSSIPLSTVSASATPIPTTQPTGGLSQPGGSGYSNILRIALGVTFGGGLLVTAALAWATAWYNKRKRQQRVAPSTEFMRQIEMGDAPTFGGARSGPGMGASVSAAEGAGRTTREPSSPAAGALTEAMGVAVSDEAGPSSGILEVSR
ncbi:uncharacterized protein TRAVEDRAFT_42416 [Trametes versicolor FP-101664 SS1]|uniref:uncharacterized protein n=1 Tax=Trametes versicolor (strain FP-101664) TaxID=717944 RepID=UPI0004622AA1|nr:uncharacterized protein TRAVEDRAFT_42416 [Trametes versicolor FP-101664 SS1]EIW65018.1 hypothetical protein TRAVEDRAFT_42416 [Trametes versicolor FP-101664 SS1]